MPLHSPNQLHATQNPPVPTQPAGAAPGSLLAACVYLALHCARCGDVRQARAALPSASEIICPRCGTSCAFVYLGKGHTTRKLPFSEVRRGHPGLLHRRDEAP
jgi:hypothetical protein